MVSPEDGSALLHSLVSTPSLSGQEGAAVAVLVDWMAGHGLPAHVDAVGNAVGVLDGGSGPDGAGQREIVLLGHIDTAPGFPPVTLSDGQLYGRGSVDAKGPLAAFAAAAACAGPQPGWRIVVVGAVEEEAATSRGALQIAATHPHPDLAVIGEPSGWQRVTLGYKGRLLANATVERPLAHRSGGSPTASELAVNYWNRVVAAVAQRNEGRARIWDQILPTLRHLCSTDDGLYETATLELGFRLPLHFGPQQCQSMLRELAIDEDLSFSGPEVAYQAPKNTPLVRAFLASIRAVGGAPGFVLKTGTSDMNVVAPLWGCPILAYGPGDSRLDHTPEEHVDLAEWWRGVGIVERVLRGLVSLR